MQIPQNWNETWFIVQQRKPLEFAGKEASKFSNSCKWAWWTDCSAFRWQFICSACSCKAEHHQFFSKNWSWHLNCWGAPTGDQLLRKKIGGQLQSFQILKGKVEEREAVFWLRQRLAGLEFPKAPGENAFK